MARIQGGIDWERRRRRLRAFVAPSPAEAGEGRLQPPAGAVGGLYGCCRVKGASRLQGEREHTPERAPLEHSSIALIPCHSDWPIGGRQ